MKNIKKHIFLIFIGLMLFSASSCEDDFTSINKDPDNPDIVPTYAVFNGASRYLMDQTRNSWMSGRLSLAWMQYAAQINYLEEDKYQYRETQTTNGWDRINLAALNFKDIIDKCENPATSEQMKLYGNLENQIAVSRIMLSYTFDQLLIHFGDILYWSYGNKDAEFQGLQIKKYPQPVYAGQEKVYIDILNELKEASEQLVLTDAVFYGGAKSGDNIYNGDAKYWKKFANSLRLRIANRIKNVYPAANTVIQEAIADGAFTSNSDNAVHKYGTISVDGSPFWASFFVDSRTDFAVNGQFVRLLKGISGNFGPDPRLRKMAAPTGLGRISDISGYVEDEPSNVYVGMPYALPANRLTANKAVESLSFFSRNVLKPDYGEVLMEYAEVAFIQSELNGWNQSYYEKGVRASLEKWGIVGSVADEYISRLPAANEANILNQKHIALFMQGAQAWAEYRRTGYPKGDILLLPGGTGYEIDGVTTYIFTPLKTGNVTPTDIPARVRYPYEHQTLNRVSWKAAAERLSNGDEVDSKLWFAK